MGNRLTNEKADLILHLDNTTIHRLQFLISKNLNSASNPDIEFMNVLHLLESLLLADQVTIASFESEPSQLISNSLLEVIDSLTGSLSIKKHESTLDMQLKTARETVEEIYEQNLLSFKPAEDSKLFTKIDVATARPEGVVEINYSFWEEIFNKRKTIKYSDVVEKAASRVLEYRTDALFIYGIANHPEFYNKLMASYSKFGIWSEDHWNKLHVMFRSYSNQNLSHELGSVYSPPPVRSITLENVHSKIITDIKSTIDDLPSKFITKENKDLFESMAKGIEFPIPLIGIAAIPQEHIKDKSYFIENFLKVREETAGLRNIIRKLNKFDQEGTVDGELDLLKESLEVKREIAKILNLHDPVVFPKKVNDIGFLRKNLEVLGQFLKRENKTARFFSNLILRMKDTPNLAAIKQYLDS
jgi:hypothetical protein